MGGGEGEGHKGLKTEDYAGFLAPAPWAPLLGGEPLLPPSNFPLGGGLAGAGTPL